MMSASTTSLVRPEVNVIMLTLLAVADIVVWAHNIHLLLSI
jgi:hypothetical protein